MSLTVRLKNLRFLRIPAKSWLILLQAYSLLLLMRSITWGGAPSYDVADLQSAHPGKNFALITKTFTLSGGFNYGVLDISLPKL